MYRSLSDHGTLTDYVYVLPMSNHQFQGRSQSETPSFPPLRASYPPQFSPGASNPTALRGGTKGDSPMHIVSVAQSEGTRMTYSTTAFSPTDSGEIQVELARRGSVFSLENTHDKPNSAMV
jgi:hypothetical protein